MNTLRATQKSAAPGSDPPPEPESPPDTDPGDEPSPGEGDLFGEMDELSFRDEANTALDLDDEEATKLDVGIEVHVPTDKSEGEPTELVLDIASMLNEPAATDEDAEDALGTGEGTGFERDMFSDEQLPVNDADEGTGEPEESLLDEALPELDADEAGDADLDMAGADHELSLDEADESLVEAAQAWRVELVSTIPFNCLAVHENKVAAGGHSLSVVRSSAGIQQYDWPSEAITALAFVEGSELILGTTSGLIGRTKLGAAGTPRICELGASPAAIRKLLTSGSGGICWAWRADGSVLSSHDGAVTWQTLSLPGPALALTVDQDEPVMVVRDDQGAALLRDGHVVTRALPRELSGSRHPFELVCSGNMVAMASFESGLHVSADAAKSFDRVPGMQATTALHLAESRLYAARYQDLQEQTELAEIALTTLLARRVTVYGGEGDPDAVEVGRTEALRGESTGSGALWAAGGFGLLRLVPHE